ncbi:hypothetical protein HDU96_008076 [Phlyctochytrium bullatum]|nr:hypothetical protein HDU96_008076 [Phlyctochytrium bullatum]
MAPPDSEDFDPFAEATEEDIRIAAERTELVSTAKQQLLQSIDDAGAASVEQRRKRYILNKPLRSTVLLTLQSVWSSEECSTIRHAIAQAIDRRGGHWTSERHVAFPTCDIPAAEVYSALFGNEEQNNWIYRSIVDRVLSAAAEKAGFQVEDLYLVDLFFVRYTFDETDPSRAQRGLEPHTDGCLLSFNISLSNPDEYESGGTLFCDLPDPFSGAKGWTVREADLRGICGYGAEGWFQYVTVAEEVRRARAVADLELETPVKI